ncbi:hypothetical protein [Thaumasiovibrio subtropicus]|uniref:hypothetical protein n=1 Tax=Thaumasiovibrio subtropicus TaxID=1891207 RepID=UPI000B34F17D|nr:hypothetical protein [Thaumasiovibrio subtropicus]
MHRTSRNTPKEIYHGIPNGWKKSQILKKYSQLGGTNLHTYDTSDNANVTSFRQAWVDYRDTLREIAELVRVGDAAAIEIAVQYIELDYFGSYSGYLKERLARVLKHQELTQRQRVRLRHHIVRLQNDGVSFQEFREYRKLLTAI